MAGLDTTQGKPIFPPRFVPYLEKHRIFELFHELAEMLVQERPKDHVKFLKAMLPCAARRRDKPRIVFFSPPGFERDDFAEEVAKKLDIIPMSRFSFEMRERERKLLERLKKMEEVRAMPEEEEEGLSCICPPEGEDDYEFPQLFDDYEAPTEVPQMEAPEEAMAVAEEQELVIEAEVEEEVEEEEDPCKGLRVCPCKTAEEIAELRKKLEEREEEEEGAPPSEQPKKEEVPGEGADSDVDRIPRSAVVPSATVLGSPPTSQTSELSCVCESSEMSDTDYAMLGKCEYTKCGWILVDFPSDPREAERLTALGVIPTHAIRLLDGTEPYRSRRFKYLTRNWMSVYRGIPVMDIKIKGRSPARLATDLSRILGTMPHRHAPMLPRVVIIGSRGSGATTQAQLLQKKYRMVHVEFDEEMAKVVLQDNNLSQMYRRQLETRPDPELEAALLEKILLQPRCRKRGWVLTGYPKTIDQLRMLDIMATPPNRVIFLDVPAKECFVRLYYRKTDWSDAKEYKIPAIQPGGLELRDPAPDVDPDVAARLLPHPRDDRRRIIHDIEEFFDEREEMSRYCGKTATHVNGNKAIETVFELVDKVIIDPSPAQPPRNPLAVNHGIEDAYERLKRIRMESGITANNLLINPPTPIFKL